MKKAFVLSYDGTSFHGWQRQKSLPTVQEAMENAMCALTGCDTYVSGCGRTDAGVHAAYYVASCETDTAIPDARLPYALNAHLPPEITVRKAVSVPDDFDARFSCTRKEYTYVIDNGEFRDPLKINRATYVKKHLDEELMAEGAKHLLGRHDFASFRCFGSNVKSTVRTLFTCDVQRCGDLIKIRTSADGFLYNMVRNIAGTLIYAGLKKFEPSDVKTILDKCDIRACGPCAEAGGLYMTGLWYGLEGLDGGKGI